MDKPKKIKPGLEITPEIVKEHGLTVEEFRRILDLIGRTPNMTELGIFSVMGASIAVTKVPVLI